MSQLASKLAAPPAPAPAPPKSQLSDRLATCLRGELATLPVLGEVWIELAGERVVTEIESVVLSEMAALNLQPTVLNARSYESCRIRHTLARCVREAARHDVPFGSADDWAKVDSDLVIACGMVYSDVRERLDPVGMSTLSQADFEAIRIAVEKKNPTSLRSYGVVALSIYMLITASLPSTSPIPASSTGE